MTNPHLKKQVLEVLDQCVLTSEEIWRELRKMLEREGIPPPPLEQRQATEMEMVRELHVRLKEQSRERLVAPLTNYTVNEDTAVGIANYLTATCSAPAMDVEEARRPTKKLKPSQVREGALPKSSSSDMVE